MHNNSRGRGWNGKRVAHGRGGNSSTGPGEKRYKNDEDMEEGDDIISQFPLMLDDGDEMQLDVAMLEEAEEVVDDIETDRIKQWKRPEPPQIDPTKDTFLFQQIDIDQYIGKPLAGMPGASSGPVPVMRMFGVTEKVILDST